MKNFELDFGYIYDSIIPKPINKVPVLGNESKMTRVAFDLFKLDGDNKEDLWMVQADDDGKEFLVRTDRFLEEDESKLVTSNWTVLLDKKASNLTILHKNIPITRLAMKDFGIKNEKDANVFSNVVFNKFATDKEFIEKFLSELPPEALGLIGTPECSECQKDDFQIQPSQHEGLVLIMDQPTSHEEEEHEEEEKDSPPEGEAQDAEEWWENLSKEEQDSFFTKFKDSSITKAQAMALIKLEAKLSK